MIENALDEVILPFCVNGLRGGTSPAEQHASCQVLEATAIAAGECVALIHEARLDIGIDKSGAAGLNLNASDWRNRRGMYICLDLRLLGF